MIHRTSLLVGSLAAAATLVVAMAAARFAPAQSTPQSIVDAAATIETPALATVTPEPSPTIVYDTVYVKPEPTQAVIHVTKKVRATPAPTSAPAAVTSQTGTGGEHEEGGEDGHEGSDD